MTASSEALANSVTIDDVRAAARRIAPHAVTTPVLRNTYIDRLIGCAVFFKCENLQRGGAFKLRGALNAVLSLDETEARRGVATHSSGNHGNALAIAANVCGIPAYVVVPSNATKAKVAAILENGGEVIECEPTLAARERTLAEVVARTGAHVVHPYDDPRIIAGQGTTALELLTSTPNLAQIWTPVGGGGLCAGTSVVCAAMDGAPRVIGAEPAAADDAFRSMAAGRIVPQTDPRTIADGLLTSLGVHNFAILRAKDVRVTVASEAGIVSAMRLLWERLKVIVEPSAAVPFAAMLENPNLVSGDRVAVILSGGNVDLKW